MTKIPTKFLKRYNRKLLLILIPIFSISSVISVHYWSQPGTISNTVKNYSRIVTNYDYKAEITPNVLYPNGGTFEAGNTIFQKITTAIPLNLKSTIYSENQVTAKGTYDVQLVINAGDLWERKFPLEQKQEFEQSGTQITVMDDLYTIDLEMIKTFIQKVENETGIVPNQYKIEVVPDIKGSITDGENVKAISIQDKLKFLYTTEEIVLDSEKTFTFINPMTTTRIVKNLIEFQGIALPLNAIRVASSGIAVMSVLMIIYVYQNNATNSGLSGISKVKKINRKYQNRIIPVSQKLNIAQKSIFTLYDFSSLIKISDERELPIFFYNDHQNESAVYIIADGNYLYSFEITKTDIVLGRKKDLGGEKAYARA